VDASGGLGEQGSVGDLGGGDSFEDLTKQLQQSQGQSGQQEEDDPAADAIAIGNIDVATASKRRPPKA
jgi:hypothetical protein